MPKCIIQEFILNIIVAVAHISDAGPNPLT